MSVYGPRVNGILAGRLRARGRPRPRRCRRGLISMPESVSRRSSAVATGPCYVHTDVGDEASTCPGPGRAGGATGGVRGETAEEGAQEAAASAPARVPARRDAREGRLRARRRAAPGRVQALQRPCDRRLGRERPGQVQPGRQVHRLRRRGRPGDRRQGAERRPALGAGRPRQRVDLEGRRCPDRPPPHPCRRLGRGLGAVDAAGQPADLAVALPAQAVPAGDLDLVPGHGQPPPRRRSVQGRTDA